MKITIIRTRDVCIVRPYLFVTSGDKNNSGRLS